MILELPDDAVNDLVRDGLRRTIEKARASHWTNVLHRINGRDEQAEADWIKYLRIIEDTQERF